MSVRTVRTHSIVVRAVAALARILLAGLLVYALIPASPARADTPVCGQIAVDTTWSPAGNNYIVTCIVHVLEGVTLTIEPGVRVQFDPGASLRIDGALIAQGVTFVSNLASPAPGAWGRIFFGPLSDDAVLDTSGNYLSGSKIQGSTIVYGGGGTGITGSIITDGASPLLDGNLVRFSSTRGIYAVGRSTTNRIVIRGNSVIDNSGGGIHVLSGDLRQNTIADNTGGEGGGVWADNSYLEDNQISQNSSSEWGGGIHASNSTLVGNLVDANAADVGGGIVSIGSSLTGNTVSGNTASSLYGGQGGGVHATGGVLISNIISGNHALGDWGASNGGGVYIASGTVLSNTVTGNIAEGGTSTVMGGGIYASLSTIAGNEIRDNTARHTGRNVSGGGIYVSGGTVTENTIAGNTASTSGATNIGLGGGIYAHGGTISGNTISNNTAAGGADSQGGGVYGTVNTVSGNSVSGNSANRGGAIYSHQGTVVDNTVTNNTTSLSGNVYIFEGTALGNTVTGNSATNGGGICGNNAVLTGNAVQNNTANLGGGIIATGSTVRGNTVTGNAAQSDGGGIHADGGTVTGNTITGNTVPSYGHGSGAYLSGAGEFTYNSVTANTASGGTAGGISIDGQPQVQFNNLYDNEPYDAEVLSADPVTGTLNYWGESVCTAIPWQIYDGNDLPGRGILSYAPSLYSPVPVAQLDAPTDLQIDIGEGAVGLSWTPIAPLPDIGCRPPGSTDPDLVYHVWYSVGKPCGPFDGTGLPAGDSPIDVGEATSYMVEGLGSGEYYFVVAAHDYLGRESASTNSVVRPPTAYWLYLPLVLR
jgi:predicted outer membrane repeat protein